MPAVRPTDEIKVGRRLTDADMVGIALDLLEEHQILEGKGSLRYWLEVLSERRPRPKEIA